MDDTIDVANQFIATFEGRHAEALGIMVEPIEIETDTGTYSIDCVDGPVSYRGVTSR